MLKLRFNCRKKGEQKEKGRGRDDSGDEEWVDAKTFIHFADR